MDPQDEPGLAARGLRLDELVVGRPAAESGRQDVVQRPRDVGVVEGHPPRRELLEAPDALEVERPAKALERAAARTLRQAPPVAQRRVQQDDRRGGPQRRRHQSVLGQARRPRRRSGLDQRHAIELDVQVVRRPRG
jgi:hypothetical protein